MEFPSWNSSFRIEIRGRNELRHPELILLPSNLGDNAQQYKKRPFSNVTWTIGTFLTTGLLTPRFGTAVPFFRDCLSVIIFCHFGYPFSPPNHMVTFFLQQLESPNPSFPTELWPSSPEDNVIWYMMLFFDSMWSDTSVFAAEIALFLAIS